MQRDNAQANISNNTISGNSDSVMDQLGTTTALMNTSSNVGSRPVSGSPRTPGSAGRSKVFDQIFLSGYLIYLVNKIYYFNFHDYF